MRSEVSENLYWVERRDMAQPCVTKRLADVDSILTRAEQGLSFPLVQRVGIPQTVKLTDLRWQANAQSGRASLFTGNEQRFFDNMYFTTDNFRKFSSLEEVAWIKLQTLLGKDHLAPDSVDRLREAWVEARYYNQRLHYIAERAEPWASALHLKARNPGNFDATAYGLMSQEMCQPIAGKHTPAPA